MINVELSWFVYQVSHIRKLTLNQLFQNPFKAFLALACFAIGIIIIKCLLTAVEDLELIGRHAEAAAAVNQEGFINRQN